MDQMVMPRKLPDLAPALTVAEVAKLQGCSTDSVRRHHRSWTSEHGFPAAISLPGVRGLCWNAAAVTAWQLQRAAAANHVGATDWHAIAEARGALLDAGLDPDDLAAPN